MCSDLDVKMKTFGKRSFNMFENILYIEVNYTPLLSTSSLFRGNIPPAVGMLMFSSCMPFFYYLAFY